MNYQLGSKNLVRLKFCGVNSRMHIMKWVIPEKIHTPPTDGELEILAGGGVKGSEIQAGGGSSAYNSSSGVIFNHSTLFK